VETVSSDRQSKDVVYAAAQGREYLRGQLDGKSPEYVRRFAGMVDDRQTLDLLNHLCSIWHPRRDDQAPDNFLSTALAEEIITSAHTRSIDEAYRSGNVSQLQGMVGLTNHTRDGGEAIPDMAAELSREGTIGGVVGRPGSGKTAIGIDVSNTWKAVTGGTVVTNITSWGRADYHATSASELKRLMGEIDGQVLALIDEGSQSLTSKGSEAVDADAFAKFLKYIRKQEDGDEYAKQGSALIIGHTKRDTGADIRRLYNFLIEKPNPNDPTKARILESESGKDQFSVRAEYSGITDTSEQYNEHEASEFTVDLDDEDDQDDTPTAEEIRKDEQRKTALRRKLDGATHKEAAKAVDYGRGWVGDVWVAWKEDGEYRNLVDWPDDLDTLPDRVASELEEHA
jgi:hypothetical protein